MFWAPLKADNVSLKDRTISGGKRFKRTKKKVEFELTEEDMKYLKENTRYDEEEIKEWFRWGKLELNISSWKPDKYTYL